MADARTDKSALDGRKLSPKNRRLLKWIEEQLRRGPDEDDAWWDEFEVFVRSHRLNLGRGES